MEFYSQNFEDVLLARCFADQSNGFYIDVGAQHEEADSVTRHFYDSGWSGINIEPVSEFAETFKCRIRDQTICCAAGSREDTMPMAVSLASGLSSFNQVNAAKTKSMGLLSETRLVKICTLNSIMPELGVTAKEFEFLKVEVEGFELEVMKGIDLNRYRPRVILCEATQPNTGKLVANFDQLCHEVESHHYHKLYFDGLNQWWASAETYGEPSQHFILPPGVMDSTQLTPYSGTMARKQLEETRRRLEQVEKSLNEMTDFRNQLVAMHSSRSWKITSPLRKAAQLIKRLRH